MPVFEVWHDFHNRRFLISKDKGQDYEIDANDLREIAYEHFKRTGIEIKDIRGNEEWVWQQAVKQSQYIDFQEIKHEIVKV